MDVLDLDLDWSRTLRPPSLVFIFNHFFRCLHASQGIIHAVYLQLKSDPNLLKILFYALYSLIGCPIDFRL